jgi:hypothetical protein
MRVSGRLLFATAVRSRKRLGSIASPLPAFWTTPRAQSVQTAAAKPLTSFLNQLSKRSPRPGRWP